MAVSTVQQSPTLAGDLERLRELVASIQGTAGQLRLFRSDFVPSAASVEADFEAAEVDFDTYAAAAIAYGPLTVDGSGRAAVHSGDLLFQNVAGTAATPGGDLVGGAWIRTHQTGPPAVDVPVTYFLFENPVAVTQPLAAFTIDVVQVGDLSQSYVILET